MNLDYSKTLYIRIIQLLDYTSLNEHDNEESIKSFCARAKNPFATPAAICTYPQFLPLINTQVQDLGIPTVSIATVINFPLGNQSISEIASASEQAIEEGATELDLVMPYRDFLVGNESHVRQTIDCCKKICGAKTKLKVIIESGELKEEKLIARATELALYHGADFIKTSTGKTTVGATIEAAKVILKTIKRYGTIENGFKASGGIKTIQQAVQYIDLVEKVMGAEWATKKNFRIGASSLLDQLVNTLALTKEDMYVSK